MSNFSTIAEIQQHVGKLAKINCIFSGVNMKNCGRLQSMTNVVCLILAYHSPPTPYDYHCDPFVTFDKVVVKGEPGIKLVQAEGTSGYFVLEIFVQNQKILISMNNTHIELLKD